MSRYRLFDRSRIVMADLRSRGHDLLVEDIRPLSPPESPIDCRELDGVVQAVVDARRQGRPVILMMGAHPIKLGLSRILIDLLQRDVITHLAVNGAGVIHDFEIALGQGTSENVARWIQEGQFGLWQQTSMLNDIISDAADQDEGLAEGVGRTILERQLPNADLSLAATAYRLGVPMSCHVSVGSDIIHAHANCSGAALGSTSYCDFLMFAQAVSQLSGGVYLNVGSAVTGPEVYLKALSMARNVARQQGSQITDFTTAVFDLIPLPPDYRTGPPSKSHPMYYYRPWKTILVRTVADGGRSYYVCGDHGQVLPTLWHRVTRQLTDQSVCKSSAA